MAADIVVQGEALASASGRFVTVATSLVEIDTADAVASAAAGISGTQTAASVSSLAIRLSTGTSAYAVGINALAGSTVEAAGAYRDAEEHVVAEIMQVTAGG
ncbi:hypothetical protein GCM10009795_048740 [Nocardioides hankookensis]|uniref:DUF2190 family protein n=1 Tax=Nocardioides hankookensis TaxID=443157 RepID=A0ABW1LE49_9ACTN